MIKQKSAPAHADALFDFHINLLRQDKRKKVDDRKYPGRNGNLLDFARAKGYDDVRDDTRADALGNAVTEHHDDERRKADDGFRRVLPIYLGYGRHHEHADPNERRRRRTVGNKLRDRAEEHSKRKADRRNERREARLAARRNARGRFYERGNGGSTRNRADARSDRVGEHHLIHAAGSTVLVEQIALCASAVERSDGIEHIDHAEGKRSGYDEQNKRTRAAFVPRKVKALHEYLTDRLRSPILERVERILNGDSLEQFYAYGVVPGAAQSHERIVRNSRSENTPENGTLDVLFRENCNRKHAEERKDGTNYRAVREALRKHVEGGKGYERGIAVDDNARVLHTDKGDKQTDTDGNSVPYACGNGLENLLSQSRYGENNKDNAVEQSEHHRVRIGKPRALNERKYDKRVNAHSRSLRERHSCKQRHE